MLAGLWLTALLTVVLEGSALDPSSLQTAVASCDEVLADRCLAEGDEGDEESALGAGFYVHLEADAALSTVRLEVRRGKAGTLSLARTLAFEETATREERARTIGLVAAAHVLDVTRREEAEAAAAAAAHVAEPTIAPTSERVYSLDLAPFVGSALDAGPLRGGLMVRGAMRARALPLGLLVSARGAYRHAQPRLWWAGATLGVFARQELKRAGGSPARWALEARLEAVTQHTEATARQGDARAHSGTWRYGGQLGTELFVRLARSSWLFFGAEGSLLRPRVDVRLRGRVVGSEPPGCWSLLLGARTSW